MTTPPPYSIVAVVSAAVTATATTTAAATCCRAMHVHLGLYAVHLERWMALIRPEQLLLWVRAEAVAPTPALQRSFIAARKTCA